MRRGSTSVEGAWRTAVKAAERGSSDAPLRAVTDDWSPWLMARCCCVPRLGHHQVQGHDFQPETDDPLHESPQGRLIRQLGAQGCRVRAYGHLAVVEFGTYGGACLTRESDVIHGHGHQATRP